MVNNEKTETEDGENLKIDLQSEEHNKLIEKLELVAAETEEIKSSQKRKFDEIQGKLQEMEESISKIPKFDEKPTSAKTFVLKHVYKNAIEFEEDKCNYSEWENHFSVNWKMSVKRRNNHMSFFVHCEPIDPKGEWSVQTKMMLKVVGKDQEVVIRSGDCCYEESEEQGYFTFLLLEWEEMKIWYLVDGNLTVEAKVTIMETAGLAKDNFRKFDESQKDVSDYLAAQSSFFKTFFLGSFSESSQSEIPLSGIDSNDFQCFLEVLYGENAIDDSTVEGILHIADMYATPMVVRKCEEFLLEKSKKSAKKLLEMAARYNLGNLKKKCMLDIKTLADFQSILPGDFQTFSHSMMTELLEKARTLQ
ncbi:hypothetical protein B9Z55_006900 [Caenorhabditis nigoni]|uniref:BTB domain-containing protein n=1 Tax=Caenorhabditis nigoni TaxID=1611254 RepID=A0A2G5V722_9PELO|nr:hypothetical protein B9Z55_006900 [Caenorhabditis nigoni]